MPRLSRHLPNMASRDRSGLLRSSPTATRMTDWAGKRTMRPHRLPQGSELRSLNANTTFMNGVFQALMFMRNPSDTCLDVNDGAATKDHVDDPQLEFTTRHLACPLAQVMLVKTT
jgi:hypothetical protein